MLEQILNNWVCWAILLIALVVYQIIWHDILFVKKHQQLRTGHWSELSTLLTAALPLMGLLGTIIGLLDAFSLMAVGLTDLLSSAIGDALLTTQLGLLCAIPAWLMQSYLAKLQQKTHVSGFQVRFDSTAQVLTDVIFEQAIADVIAADVIANEEQVIINSSPTPLVA